jgi:hypothetical protein
MSNELLFLKYEYSVKAKYEAWVQNNWCDGFGTPIKNWKSKVKNAIIAPISKHLPTTGNIVSKIKNEAIEGVL